MLYYRASDRKLAPLALYVVAILSTGVFPTGEDVRKQRTPYEYPAFDCGIPHFEPHTEKLLYFE